MRRVRIVTLAGDPEREASLATRLAARDDVEVVLRCVDRVELLGAVRGSGLDAVVAVGAPVWFDAQGAHEAARAGVRIVAVVARAQEGDRLAELGATLVPEGAALDEIVERCTSSEIALPATPRPSQEPQRRGDVVAVWGPKGAPGRTTLAIELAWELASGEPATLLVDADHYGGDVVQLLGIVEELPTVVWAAQLAASGRLDAGVLGGELRRAGRHGPVVLPGLPRSTLWADVSDFGWRRLLEAARASFRFTVCDVGFCLEPGAPWPTAIDEGRNRMGRVAVADADSVVAVCRADPVGIKSFLWAFDDLRELVDADRIMIVANRVRASGEGEVAELLRRHIGRRPVAYVADRPHELRRAVMGGTALRETAPRSDVVEAVRAVAAAVGGSVRPRGVMARLAGRA